MGTLKTKIEKQLHRAAQAFEAALDRGREVLGGPFAVPTAAEAEHIAAYRGYATPDKIVASGRVLANPAAREATDDDRWRQNFGNLWRRIHSREVPGARVVLRHGEQQQTVITDEEGYYHVEFDIRESETPNPHEFWTRISATVPDAETETAVSAEHAILRPSKDARFGIISDMDDTVIHTGATKLLLMARQTLFGNARLRQPLAGVSALYSALQHEAERPTNPLFYVSSSPWNLYDLLEEFLAHNGIPPGPLLLRDYGIDDTKLFAEKGHGHKLEKTERILTAYPDLPFVLIGDSGQDDAELYAEAARSFPDRIRAIYIRDVDPDEDEDSEHDARVDEFIEVAHNYGVPMLRAPDSLAMANHAAELGLIENASLGSIAADVERDHHRPATVGEAIEEAVKS